MAVSMIISEQYKSGSVFLAISTFQDFNEPYCRTHFYTSEPFWHFLHEYMIQ